MPPSYHAAPALPAASPPIAAATGIYSAPTARWAGLILVVAAALLYFATLDTGLEPRELRGGDLITHQYAQVQARPSNAPGYPIYTMGGWLWFHGLRGMLHLLGNPLPNPLPILSSYSVLWALLALWLLYAIVLRLTAQPDRPSGNWPVAWLLAAFYAVTYFFWYYATTTEQYSSAIAQTLAIFYVYLLWDAHPDGPLWRLYALAFLCGLSLAHMLTVALIVPPVVAAVLWRRPVLLRQPRAVIGALIAALLPLISYSYVYLRGVAHPEWWGAQTWANANQWFWAFVSTAQGRDELMWGFEPGRAFLGNGFPELIWQELSVPLLVIGLIGIALLHRRHAAVLYATLVFYLLFDWAYRYGNWFQVILPAYPLVLIGAAQAADWWQIWAGAHTGPRLRRGLTALPLVALAALIVWRIQASLPAANSRGRPEDTALMQAAKLLARPLPSGAALFAAVDDALALQYLTQIWGIQPTLHVVSSRAASDLLAHSKPVLASTDAAGTLLAELEDIPAPATQSAGPLWVALLPSQGIEPGLAHEMMGTAEVSLTQVITLGLSLVGYTAEPAMPPAGGIADSAPALDITLYWLNASGDWPSDLSISVRPTLHGDYIPAPERDGTIVQVDRSRPIAGLYAPPNGEGAALIADAYRLPLAAPLPANADGVTVLLYRAADGAFEDIARLDLPLP